MKFRRCLGALLVALCGHAGAGEVLLATEEAPPFNYTNADGKSVGGGSTEVVQEMFRRAAIPYRIEVYPWARAFNMAQTRADTCVFSTTRTTEREPLFTWVGPISLSEWTLFARGDSAIQLASVESARSYLIGGYFGDAVLLYLSAQKFNVAEARNDEHLIQLLQRKQIDLWATDRASGHYLSKKMGIAVKPLLSFNKAYMYLACNKQLDPGTTERLNGALKSLAKDGMLAKIGKKFQTF